MKDILNYLKQCIDKDAVVERWNAKQCLSIQLAGKYDYYIVTVLTESFLLIKPMEEQTISKIKTHIMKIRENAKYEVAVLLEDATSYRIKKMLEERIAFLAVDKQMFLPFLALHIKKKQERKIEAEKREKFAASTQMVFLALLYSDEKKYGAEELARELNVSAMTVLRAMDELKKIGIVNCEIGGQTGRKKIFKPIDKNEYYRIGKEYLFNPVKRSVDVRFIPDDMKIYKSGLTALGEQTMLGEPNREIFAVYGNLKTLEKYQISRFQALEEGLPEIQIMQYDIGKLTGNQYVDPITLILSLGEKDERIEMAIDELMREAEWYEA